MMKDDRANDMDWDENPDSCEAISPTPRMPGLNLYLCICILRAGHDGQHRCHCEKQWDRLK
jgi:hypothetical protein